MSVRRYLSLRRANAALPSLSEKGAADTDIAAHTTPSIRDNETERNASTAALLPSATPLAPPNLKVKRVDHYYSKWSKAWKYRNTGDKVTPEHVPVGAATVNDPWGAFCFVVVRTFPRDKDESEPTFKVIIKSPYLLRACEDVIQNYPGLSWNVDPVTLDPQMLLTFLPLFEEYRDRLQEKRQRTLEEGYTMSSVGVLIDYLHRDYRSTLGTLARMTAHGEISFDLLYAIFVPRSILITTCPTTGEPRAVQLVSAAKVVCDTGRGLYDLLCESVDEDDGDGQANGWPPQPGESAASRARAFGRVCHKIIIPQFQGTVKISELDAYPIKYHPNAAALKEALVVRGRRWAHYRGIHHVQYDGRAVVDQASLGGCKQIVKYNVSSRIMIDRANFRRLNPNYAMPHIKQESQNTPTHMPPPPGYPNIYAGSNASLAMQPPMIMPPPARYNVPVGIPGMNTGIPTVMNAESNKLKPVEEELSDEELLLASPVLYGFSLADKIWLEFNVESVSEIEWNEEAFANLVLPLDRKTLLRSLVEAHNSHLDFDDFVKGKGHGLVINLFGPPGVGKTLSAEATSEHVRRPLYVIGGGDLGTNGVELNATLQRVFDIATSWQAIVLIDEADVFLEQRSLHDLERNAMVAVFLRHLEYYRGILFLTTNRVKTFDEAFLSRIHVALHFRELSPAARAQVWRAFLAKVGVEVGAAGASVSEDQLGRLAGRDVNGRQIKNATRTACSLAVARAEPLQFAHLVETLDAMEEFTAEFKSITAA